MHLSSLRLRSFRNFLDQRLEFPAEGVALLGDNGQGKTNLLESIYYLAIFRSFRGAPDEQLVHFGEEVFRLDAVFRRGDRDEEIASAFDRRSRKKKVTLNGSEPARLADAVGRLAVVIFSPADVAIVAGSPGERRRFLDIVLSMTEPGYLLALQRYRQVLTRRNALLRQGAAPALVAAWDEGLVGWGSRVAMARARWVAGAAASFAGYVARISGGGEAMLEYDASLAPEQERLAGEAEPSPAASPEGETVAALADLFRTRLERAAEREARRGMTLVGPHRDDLVIRARSDSGWVDLRVYGSGGQQRTAAVALRMVEAESLRAATGSDPLILLDDVFAELDAGRSARILEWIEREEHGAQVILTAPKESDFDLRGGSLARWRISAGEIRMF